MYFKHILDLVLGGVCLLLINFRLIYVYVILVWDDFAFILYLYFPSFSRTKIVKPRRSDLRPHICFRSSANVELVLYYLHTHDKYTLSPVCFITIYWSCIRYICIEVDKFIFSIYFKTILFMFMNILIWVKVTSQL